MLNLFLVLFIIHNRCAFDAFIVIISMPLFEHQDNDDNDDQDAHTCDVPAMYQFLHLHVTFQYSFTFRSGFQLVSINSPSLLFYQGR